MRAQGEECQRKNQKACVYNSHRGPARRILSVRVHLLASEICKNILANCHPRSVTDYRSTRTSAEAVARRQAARLGVNAFSSCQNPSSVFSPVNVPLLFPQRKRRFRRVSDYGLMWHDAQHEKHACKLAWLCAHSMVVLVGEGARCPTC